jgi:hypothetical protein
MVEPRTPEVVFNMLSFYVEVLVLKHRQVQWEICTISTRRQQLGQT